MRSGMICYLYVHPGMSSFRIFDYRRNIRGNMCSPLHKKWDDRYFHRFPANTVLYHIMKGRFGVLQVCALHDLVSTAFFHLGAHLPNSIFRTPDFTPMAQDNNSCFQVISPIRTTCRTVVSIIARGKSQINIGGRRRMKIYTYDHKKPILDQTSLMSTV